jgi:hypothetical protein
LAQVPPRVFADRLQLVLNAWYQMTLAHDNAAVYTSNPMNLSTYAFGFGSQLPANGSLPQLVVNRACRIMCTRSTLAALTHSVEVFA